VQKNKVVNKTLRMGTSRVMLARMNESLLVQMQMRVMSTYVQPTEHIRTTHTNPVRWTRAAPPIQPHSLPDDSHLRRPQTPILYPIPDLERVHDDPRLDLPSFLFTIIPVCRRQRLRCRQRDLEKRLVPVRVEGFADGSEGRDPVGGKRREKLAVGEDDSL